MMALIFIMLALNGLAVQASSKEATVIATSSFVEALKSDGLSADIPPESDIYGWLIGSWKIRIIDYGEDGSKQEAPGEWHFTRVLEGRAVQDVFIVPSRPTRSPGIPKVGNRYGSTLRYYDDQIDAWHITWINPVRHIENHLIARKVGNEIVQEGKDDNGSWERWTFRDITSDSFRWTGEESSDEGKTWRLSVEFFGVRMANSE